MTKIKYFCVGCRQVHYDKDFNGMDGDLRITDWDKFMKSVIEINFALGRVSDE